MINEDFHALFENHKEQYKDPGFKYMSDIERAADEINSHIDNYKIAKCKTSFIIFLMTENLYELREYCILRLHVLATT
jgi:hypothetical protein